MANQNTIADLSTTPASNLNFKGQNIRGTALANTIDTMFQNEASMLKAFYDSLGGVATVSGTDTYTVTITEDWAAYGSGLWLAIKPANANTGAATLNVTVPTAGALGAKAIRRQGDSALQANDMVANGVYLLRYSTSYNSSAGAWILLNPAIAVAAATTTTSAPQGRLTLQTGVPVMVTTQSAKTTLYYTPYVGDLVPIYDGSSFTMTAFSELSIATTDTTKNPAAIGASKVNDWFVWSDSGTLRLSHGPDWTDDTTRSAGTALVLQNGIYLNNATITNGPAASRGTYVGTTRSNSSSQLDWIYAASGTAAFFYVWNMYNRVNVGSLGNEGTANWTYNSTTIRALNASAKARVSFVRGLDQDACSIFLQTYIDTVSAGNSAYFGVGLDSTTAVQTKMQAAGAAAAGIGSYLWNGVPGLGAHYLQQLESITNSGSYTAYGTSALSSFAFTGRM